MGFTTHQCEEDKLRRGYNSVAKTFDMAHAHLYILSNLILRNWIGYVLKVFSFLNNSRRKIIRGTNYTGTQIYLIIARCEFGVSSKFYSLFFVRYWGTIIRRFR